MASDSNPPLSTSILVPSCAPPSMPQFTDQDEQRELATLSPAEIATAEADLRGITAGLANVGFDEGGDGSQRMAAAIYCLDEELAKIPVSEKAAYLDAVARCPDAVDDEARFAFMERENFDARLAAGRLVRYWETKLTIFGPERCYLPLTLRGAMRDEVDGMLRYSPSLVLPVKDTAGRAIIFFDPSRRDTTNYKTKQELMAFWYMVESATEDPEVRKRGVVMILDVSNANRKHFDPIAGKFIANAFWQISSVPCRSIHVCHPNYVAYYVIYPIMRYVIGRELRLRVIMHYGTAEKVLNDLESYCLPRSCVPSELGGNVIVDIEAWANARMVLENERMTTTARRTAALGAALDNAGEINVEVRATKRVRAESCKKRARNSRTGDGSPVVGDAPQPAPAVPSVDPTILLAVSGKKTVGRKADPRMNRAVAAKLTNPHMSAYDALLLGGFEFPCSEKGKPTDASLDSDNISLQQRRNQLLRRLRKAKKNISEETSGGEGAANKASSGDGTGSTSDTSRGFCESPKPPGFNETPQPANEILSANDVDQLTEAAPSHLDDTDKRDGGEEGGQRKRRDSLDSFYETIMELPGIDDMDIDEQEEGFDMLF